MACSSKENTLNFLMSEGIVDSQGIINNSQIEEFNKLNEEYTNLAKEDYGIDISEPLFSIENKEGLSYAVPNEDAFGQIDTILEEERGLLNIDYFEDYSYDMQDQSIMPQYEKYIQYKQNLLNRLNNRLAKIRAEKKKFSSNEKKIKELTALENEINIRIEGSADQEILGLEQEISDLLKAPALSKFNYYVEKDFERLDTLSQSLNAEDLHEAKVIINFYEALGTFDTNKEHPLFLKEQIFNEKEENILPKNVIRDLSLYRARANEYNNSIKGREKRSVTDTINNNNKVRNIYKDKQFTYDELTYKEGGLKDATWSDMFLMDITNGIFSYNGIIPQVMMNTIQNSMENSLVYAKSVEARVDSLHKDVEKELINLGYDLGIGIKGVSYELFRATNEKGQFKDSITQRYTSEYQDARNKMLYDFDQALIKARNEENPSLKATMFSNANVERDNWYRKNTILMDAGSIPEVINDPEFKEFSSHFNPDKAEEHSKKLLDTLGEIGYKEEVDKQIKLLKDFKVMSEVYKDTVIVEEGVSSYDELSYEGKNKIVSWTKKNSPFLKADDYYKRGELKMGKLKLNSSMSYNYAIPRKFVSEISLKKGEFQEKITEKDTGFYDDRYKTIEENPKLKEFHNLLMEVNEKIYDTLPPEVRERFSSYSIPALKKSFIEILFDKNTPILQRLHKAYRSLIDGIKGLFGIKPENTLNYANLDPITGIPDYKVNDSFLKGNKEEISNRLFIEEQRFKQSIGYVLTEKITDYQNFNLEKLPKEAIVGLADNLGVEASLEAIQKRFPNSDLKAFPVKKALRDAVTHQVVSENSFDLPKILKLYSYLTMEYAARQEVLPTLEMLKNHYESIQKPVTTGLGKSVISAVQGGTMLEGERTNAIKQMNSWFERAVLGNYGSKNEIGDTTIKNTVDLKLTKEEEEKAFLSKYNTTIDGKIYDTDEKIIKKKIPSIQAGLEHIINESQDEKQVNQARKMHTRLVKLDAKLGKHFSVTATFDALFNFIRFKGLGWNLSSYVTNFAEGQVANMIIAATGDYFTPENIYRANHIVKGSFLKNATFGKVATDGSKKASVLMARYRVLQDASNELQKASAKTALSSFQALSPYEGTRRTEYLNQTPLMISILLDTSIVGKDGTTSNVWDAMDAEGNFLENFATEENKENWENANGEVYNSFSSKLIKLIVNTHGDYDDLRGNLASEYVSGKALLMFKRWMARQFYQRFAMTPQPDIEAGIENYKGRYLSHTAASGFLHGAIIGFGGLGLLGAGGLGLAIGGFAGGAIGKFYGVNTGMNFLQELSLVGKETFMNLIRIPVNTLTGKATVKSINLESLEDSDVSDRDMRNLKANLVDMSLTLTWIGMLLFSKALLWDDEDEKDDARRQAHNLLANRFMQLASQASMYLNPVESWNNSVGNLPILRFFNDVMKTAQQGEDFLEGKDTVTTGPNAGESKFYNQLVKTFSPSVVKDVLKGDLLGLGFTQQAEKQFKKSPFDSWFYSEEKESENKVKSLRATLRKDLEDQGLSKKEVRKKMNVLMRRRRKGESYEKLLKYYEEN